MDQLKGKKLAIKKTELYSLLWASVDELRGGMDASEYKDYVLTLLFIKYVADKNKNNPDALIGVSEGASLDDMVKLSGDKEIEVLKSKSDKSKAIKTGMMQELLTGRVRLIKKDKK
jgi:type I restriction-modification system DNA methylase subunit